MAPLLRVSRLAMFPSMLVRHRTSSFVWRERKVSDPTHPTPSSGCVCCLLSFSAQSCHLLHLTLGPNTDGWAYLYLTHLLAHLMMNLNPTPTHPLTHLPPLVTPHRPIQSLSPLNEMPLSISTPFDIAPQSHMCVAVSPAQLAPAQLAPAQLCNNPSHKIKPFLWSLFHFASLCLNSLCFIHFI
ncbi:uncharacterized protein BJ171DRAFT_193192 [Polychytrium aggregatum]|uniref:uncharacterized protein n=1 Tax=Polychytrium aggregatum TaxID=110093 RepID=UPI0022FE025B|nr:uncharacterized protein BJ171DRAFT_193192 [Polychytrium aggregatum]KAI9201942.1 hypothetical protein BJ171DRAFT_193192 [Polychytrium aggregatum]